MEELRNIGGLASPTADSSSPTAGRDVLNGKPQTYLRPLEKLRRERRHSNASDLKDLPGSQLVESLSFESAKRVPLHKWEYTDDFGKVQPLSVTAALGILRLRLSIFQAMSLSVSLFDCLGPFDALRVVKWIQSGFFDNRGTTLFRRSDEATAKPLTEHLATIIAEAYAAMMLRMQKPVKATEPEEELPEVVEEPMDIAEQLTDIESILDVKSLATTQATPYPSSQAALYALSGSCLHSSQEPWDVRPDGDPHAAQSRVQEKRLERRGLHRNGGYA
ncbi:hypothetical protein Emag_000287 [Eimeria magna]